MLKKWTKTFKWFKTCDTMFVKKIYQNQQKWWCPTAYIPSITLTNCYLMALPKRAVFVKCVVQEEPSGHTQTSLEHLNEDVGFTSSTGVFFKLNKKIIILCWNFFQQPSPVSSFENWNEWFTNVEQHTWLMQSIKQKRGSSLSFT